MIMESKQVHLIAMRVILTDEAFKIEDLLLASSQSIVSALCAQRFLGISSSWPMPR